MKWSNLNLNKCPKCGKELDFESDYEYMLCTISCGFQISVQRMKEICGDINTYKIRANNQDLLNNLGSEEVGDNSDIQEENDLL
jgi:anaerobic ribonucleoside-triphosphate reductase